MPNSHCDDANFYSVWPDYKTIDASDGSNEPNHFCGPRCNFLSFLDGSDAAFYISRNRKNRNWVIRLQAGGSCVLFSECYDRKTTAFGSSKYLQNSITGTFLTSDDPNINPTFNKWNKVFIPYCRWTKLTLLTRTE
jgi:hypothetical protein